MDQPGRPSSKVFMFNFIESPNGDSKQLSKTHLICEPDPKSSSPSCQEHRLDEEKLVELLSSVRTVKTSFKKSQLLHVSQGDVDRCCNGNGSDLVPGLYEGGMKIWECTYDVIDFIQSGFNGRLREKAKILDLGCGAGLVAIALKKMHPCWEVVFQDFNRDVIEQITIPNFKLNCSGETSDARFYSGSWSTLVSSCLAGQEQTFDYIFTSETIYNVDQYPTLVDVFDRCLKPDGFVWLAAKVNYFGVGGGIRQFESCLDQSAKFVYRSVKVLQDGVKREILEIKRSTKGAEFQEDHTR